MSIREKVEQFDKVLADIQLFPQTQKTILKSEYTNSTLAKILTRKLSNAFKYGQVYKITNFGSRFSKVVYYTIPKKYHIIITAERTGSSMFCFMQYEYISEFVISVPKCWMLDDDRWILIAQEMRFHEGSVLKWI